MPEQFNFLIVDDHPIFRQGLVAVVQSNPRYRVLAEAGNVPEALAALEKNRFDVALIDISLDGQSGLDLVKMLKASHPSVQSLMISIHDEAIYAERALKAKSWGYVMKQEAGTVLLEAIKVVLSGHIYLSPQMRDRMIENRYLQREDSEVPMVDRLSDRELEVLEHLGWGFGASEIATKLKLSVKTVGVYQDHIKKKLSIEGAAALRKFAAHWIQSQRR